MINEMIKALHSIDVTAQPDNVAIHPLDWLKLSREAPALPPDLAAETISFAGIKVVVDRALPRGTIEFRHGERVLSRIESVT
ncbi:MAG: hypothetical protein JWN13_5407 [Betaproteobacteria bacterium]|nr:hypothetical protein [Betaproteobacteria bacterium]